ncbi:PASTA domain-containing protein [Brevibacterium casei]|uniref:PASTA domain-containing protein n=1 Tax=Brevibacterium casei TaxID=33889 RepID=A0A7T9YPC8_9MICO|nr:PASTA domain-containing protein [Brevibacterium casei]MCT1551538.1 PASTA domain-containing protein [Brevibacterium casei]MCT1560981.1 PASTA domain-containing protein [Brevibacterium casei]MCT2209297.1 PASTA domain-containing protein [Brevibacterium casei]QPS33124.1 PASTA domain-containing protein [Brevibacterium casei]QQT68110.1 PASTA domain-containing protein [Brevibacterium casei]
MTDRPTGDAPQARPRQRRASKPFYKRWWVWTLAALVVLSATGLFGQTEETPETVEASSTEEPEPVTVPDLVGKAGDEAKDALDDLDLKAEFVDESDEDRSVVRKSNWNVESTSPKAGAEAAPGDAVTITVSKIDDDQESAEEEKAGEDEKAKDESPKEKKAESEAKSTDDDKFDFDYYQGEVTVQFEIDDNFTTGLVATGAKQDTIAALQAATAKYPGYKSIVVMGSGPTVDKYGNEDNSYLFSVRYTRETVEKIDFDNSALLDIWDLRDAGMVNPDLDK